MALYSRIESKPDKDFPFGFEFADANMIQFQYPETWQRR